MSQRGISPQEICKHTQAGLRGMRLSEDAIEGHRIHYDIRVHEGRLYGCWITAKTILDPDDFRAFGITADIGSWQDNTGVVFLCLIDVSRRQRSLLLDWENMETSRHISRTVSAKCTRYTS
jgi:hypothetical protein